MGAANYAMTDIDITDRVLAILKARYPEQFEIAVLTARNEILSARVAKAEAEAEAVEPETA